MFRGVNVKEDKISWNCIRALMKRNSSARGEDEIKTRETRAPDTKRARFDDEITIDSIPPECLGNTCCLLDFLLTLRSSIANKELIFVKTDPRKYPSTT